MKIIRRVALCGLVLTGAILGISLPANSAPLPSDRAATLNLVPRDSLTFTPTGSTVVSGSVEIPDGYTRALVTVAASATAWLDVKSIDQLVSVNERIDVAGHESAPFGSAGGSIGSPNSESHGDYSTIVDRPADGRIVISLWASAVYAATRTGDADLSASALFLS